MNDAPDRRQEYYSQLIADGYTEDEAHDLTQARFAMIDHEQGETQ